MTKKQHDFLKASIERSNALILSLQEENKTLKFQVESYQQFVRLFREFLGVSK